MMFVARIRVALSSGAAALVVSCASFLLVSSAAEAQSSGVGQVIDFTIPQQYISPRYMGMGNAGVALADDYSAIFYNPAGLARRTEGQVNLGIMGILDSKTIKFKNDLNSAESSGDVNQMVNFLDQNLGNYYAARASLGGFVARPGWELAIIPMDIAASMQIHAIGGGSAGLIATEDTTIAFARGWDVNWFKHDRLSFGVTGKVIYRGYYNHEFLASDLAFNSNLLRTQDAAEGGTLDADLGLLWTPKVSSSSFWRFLRPTVGFVIRNIGDYGFVENLHLIDRDTTMRPPNLGRRFDLGTAWELPSWWVFTSRFLADERDMGADNFTIRKGSHLGAEFTWKVRSWFQGGWRVGLNQGYFTAGFTGRIGIFNLDIGTEAVEVGPDSAPLASRQYLAKCSLDW